MNDKNKTNNEKTSCEICEFFVEKKNALVTLLWHQSVFNEYDFPNHSRLYEILLKECLNRGAWVTTCKDVYEHVCNQKIK